MFVFREIWCVLFFRYLRFEIRPIAFFTEHLRRTASEISYPEHFQENLVGEIMLKFEYI